MRRTIFILLTSLAARCLLNADQPRTEDELTTLKRDYADVLALQGTSKAEILAIARTMANTKRIRQPRPKQPRPFCRGGASTQVFIKKSDSLHRYTRSRL